MGRHVLRGIARCCAVGLLFALWATVLVTPGSTILRTRATPAQLDKHRLDAELQQARKTLGIPDAMLAPIVSQERQVAAVGGNPNANQQQVADDYKQLYGQLVALEQTSTQTLHDQATGDIQLYLQALSDLRSKGFSEIDIYQARLDTAQQEMSVAKTTADYAHMCDFLSAQITALRSLWPAYETLQGFDTRLRALRLAGMPSLAGEQAAQQDLAALDAPLPPAGYTALMQRIDDQTLQVMADQVSALPGTGAALLRQLQSGVKLLRQNGDTADAATLEREQNADARALGAATQPGDYLALEQTLWQQIDAQTLPLIRAQTRADVQTLSQLVAQGQKQTLLDPFTGARYPAAYEYADKEAGIGLVAQEVARAKTVADYQKADSDIGILTTNLHALLDDLKDTSPAGKPHQADLRLLSQYGLLQGKVAVVSLVEQVARFYENGKLVSWSYVTTGRIELPSPPGVHYAMTKNTPVLFTSPEPKSSPLWFAPTPVTYAIAYANGGDFMHDAWWRNKFGPGTQLPHYDPIAFNGGSHGCINFPKAEMQWVYNWMQLGTPVVVY